MKRIMGASRRMSRVWVMWALSASRSEPSQPAVPPQDQERSEDAPKRTRKALNRPTSLG